MWMVQRGKQARFTIEARSPVGICEPDGREDLDGDVAPELGIVRAVYLAHAACAQQRLNGEGTQTAADR
jgi:hypothetical protein